MKKLFLLLLFIIPCVTFSQVMQEDYYIPNYNEQLELTYQSTFKEQQKYLILGASIFHTISIINYLSFSQTNNYYQISNARISNTFAISIDAIILIRYFDEKYERKNNNYVWTH